MKDLGFVKDIVGSIDDQNHHIYQAENGVYVRDIEIDAGIGEEVTFGIVSDMHLNLCNQQDFDEGNPVILSTYENRKWLANGESVPTVRRCLESICDCDQIIANGDTLDYLSHGCMELMQNEVWDKYPNILASLGGHECTRKMQGKVEDPTTHESRLKILEKFWKHDIYYVSRLVKDKVLCVVMNNAAGRFLERQVEPLKRDIELAKKNGYPILVFFHEPINTGNPEHQVYTEEMTLLVGDRSNFPKNFYNGQPAGNKADDPSDKAVYDMLIHNADVIKGIFAGHRHSDFYLEILGTNSDGTPAKIPQYVTTATAYGSGHILRVTVK